MRESSPYEGKHDKMLNGMTCLGQVKSVDSEARTCRVTPLGLPGVTDDQDLQDVQILHQSWHPEGDQEVCLPRPGCFCAIIFINTLPFVIGYWKVLNTSGDSDANGGRTNQNSPEGIPFQAGDKVIGTVGGNLIILRVGGAVQILGDLGCRTYWLPSTGTINSVMRNLEIQPAGGNLAWTQDETTDNTVMDVTLYDNVTNPVNGARIQIGTTDIENTQGNTPVIGVDVGPLDTATMRVSASNVHLDMDADGNTNVNIAQGKITISLTPDGKITINTASDADLTVGGDANITTTGKVDITSGGDTTIDVTGDAAIKASGNVDLTAGGNANVKASQIALNGSASPATSAQAHLNVIDLITGTPVTPTTTVLLDM